MSEIAFPFVFSFFLGSYSFVAALPFLWRVGGCFYLPAFTPAQIGFGWSRNGKLAGGRNSVTLFIAVLYFSVIWVSTKVGLNGVTPGAFHLD